MDSFVHPSCWFQIDFDSKKQTFLNVFDFETMSHKLDGRMSETSACDLRIQLLNNFYLRIDDKLNSDVWAEVDVPQEMLVKKTCKRKQ